MKYLSTRRRHPLAGLVVLVLGLVLAGGFYSMVVAPATAQDDELADTELIEQGRQLFTVGCSSCHGMNAEGIPTKSGGNYGPPLVGVGAAAVDFQVSTGRMPMSRPGAQAPRKPVAFTDDEIAALAAYVASLGPGPAIPDESDYSLEGMSDEERQQAITNGGQIFLTNCTACHNFEGSGGAMPRGGAAPQIRGVEPRLIYEAMLTGPGQMDSFSNGNLSPEEKRDVIAYLGSMEDMPNYGGFGLGGLGPVVEGMVAWVFGIGLLVGAAVWIAAHTTRSTKKKVDA